MDPNETIHYNPSRRSFLINASLASLSFLAVPLFTGGCEDIFRKIKNRPVRRCIKDARAVNQQLDIYKAAVTAMRALPSSDPRNWTRQATIHDNFCPHGNWFFFPWHRIYLHNFENICRKLTNEPTFGLPYWDWCVEPRIPAQFWGAGNPLNNATRFATSASTASAVSVGLPLVDGFCDEPNFNIFAGGNAASLRPAGPRVYGNIEATPHNYIHGTFIRGDMASFMSPLDPIFWSHHCMADLCWFEWNIARAHPNTSDPVWANFDHSGMFVDGDGNPASMTSGMSQLLPLLSYRYETGIDCVEILDVKSIVAKNNTDFEKTKAIVQKGAPIRMDVKQRFRFAEKTMITSERIGGATIKTDANAFSRVIANAKDERVLLALKGVSEPVDSDLFLRVFINKEDVTAQTSTDDPHYAGSFYFFRHNRDAQIETADFTVDITSTMRNLQQTGALGDLSNLKINIVAVPVEGKDAANASIGIEAVECYIASVTTDKMDIK